VPVLAATAGAAAFDGIKPSNPRPFQSGHDLNVAEMFVWAHELMMKDCSERSLQDGDKFAGRRPCPSDWAPWSGLSPLIDPAARPKTKPRDHWENGGLINLLWHAVEIFGEDYLIAHGLQFEHYTPDLAIVQDGKIVHVIHYAADYGGRDVERIFRACLSRGVTFDLWV
jgi:hypothetical protein